ncbi:MAG TPA: sugar ABC transporter ATP-binding protein, partial [Chthonomonadales bacterium]|nr:sugar ABC transporter ATP-binding protein [Chthonomonadales bacterium]
KSTLVKILAGAISADSGEILLEGKQVHIDSPQKAMSLGVSIIYQEFNLVPYLSAGENIFLGCEPRAALPGFVDFKRLYAEAQRILDELGVRLDARTPINQLSIAQQQMVEIAKATSKQCKIITMDEPSATITQHELDALFNLIKQLSSQGVSVIYISHRLEEIFEVCSRATIMRDGKWIATEDVRNLTRESIIRLMVGRELKEAAAKEQAPPGPPMLTVKHLERKGVLHDISFEVRKGEVLGLAGLVGAGRTETARAIFGADPIDGGAIEIEGKPARIQSPQDAIRHGIGLVTEDRKQQGLVLGMAVRENNTLANLASLTTLGFIRRRQERAVAERYRKSLDIKTPTIEQTVQNLSGGNQQKVVLAKWLYTGSRVLIFDEPTRGIDVGAKSEIYKLMNELAAGGAAIIMISSELPEILAMSDRILVMHEGRIAGELSRSEATQERIMNLATGGQ